MLDTGVPESCEGTPFNWMKINPEDTVMISMALMLWSSGKKQVTIYANGKDSTGYCAISQLDPA